MLFVLRLYRPNGRITVSDTTAMLFTTSVARLLTRALRWSLMQVTMMALREDGVWPWRRQMALLSSPYGCDVNDETKTTRRC